MTTEETESRIYTLMHDPQYRLSIAWQNVGYNQPPHTSFFLGTGMEKPPAPSIDVVEIPDMNAPDTDYELKGEVQEGWYHSPVTVNLIGYDYQSGMKATYHSLNGSTEQEGNTVTITEDGKHVLEYWSVDQAGNIEQKKSIAINIDQTAPEITFSVEDGAPFTVDQHISITCQATDALSGVASSTCEDVSVPAYELGLGSHTYTAEGGDVVGNKSAKSVTINVIVNFDSLGELTKMFLTGYGVESTDVNSLDKSNKGNSLIAKLEAAQAADERGNKSARDGQLNAFINEVKAKTNKDFTDQQAQILVELAGALMK
jgi:hypothetical protein